jgi:phage virion morphogenesis protein
MSVPHIVVDDKNLERKIRELSRRSDNLQPAFEEIGEMLLSSIERNFQDEGRYSSPGSWQGGATRWEDLAPATVKSRARTGRGPHPILQISGQLAASITKHVTPSSLELGTNLAYGAIHQFGGMAGRGRKVEIPARPYLVIQDVDLHDAIEIIEEHIQAACRKP